MKLFFEWLVKSSADSSRIALSVKGFLLLLLPFVISLSGLTSLNIPNQETLASIIDMIATAIQVVFTIIGSIAAFYGIVRKILTTWQNTNQVLIEQERAEDA